MRTHHTAVLVDGHYARYPQPRSFPPWALGDDHRAHRWWSHGLCGPDQILLHHVARSYLQASLIRLPRTSKMMQASRPFGPCLEVRDSGTRHDLQAQCPFFCPEHLGWCLRTQAAIRRPRFGLLAYTSALVPDPVHCCSSHFCWRSARGQAGPLSIIKERFRGLGFRV